MLRPWISIGSALAQRLTGPLASSVAGHPHPLLRETITSIFVSWGGHTGATAAVSSEAAVNQYVTRGGVPHANAAFAWRLHGIEAGAPLRQCTASLPSSPSASSAAVIPLPASCCLPTSLSEGRSVGGHGGAASSWRRSVGPLSSPTALPQQGEALGPTCLGVSL